MELYPSVLILDDAWIAMRWMDYGRKHRFYTNSFSHLVVQKYADLYGLLQGCIRLD